MFILAGNGEAVSFNDEGSPDTRQTGLTKVYVNGQVDRDRSLNWYFRLIALFPDIPGELKSALIVARFRELPPGTQAAIWLDLAPVRIHIVDPRPHYRRIENILRRAWRRLDAPEILSQMAAEGMPHARQLSMQLREMVADSILHDSTARRVLSLGRALADPFGDGQADDLRPIFVRPQNASRSLVTIEDFGGQSGLVGKVASWSAKSSAAFHAALDAAAFQDESAGMLYRFDLGTGLVRRMVQQLQPVHAFDGGNKKHIELLEATRHSIIRELVAHDRLYGLMTRNGFVELESKESYYVQAADFAAGIASNIYASEGLAGVILRFEYVTYNGVRVSLADAEDEIKRQKALDF